MNGNFEVNDSAYPIGYMKRDDGYVVHDMRTLQPLHSRVFSVKECAEVCKLANARIRAAWAAAGHVNQVDAQLIVAQVIAGKEG